MPGPLLHISGEQLPPESRRVQAAADQAGARLSVVRFPARTPTAVRTL